MQAIVICTVNSPSIHVLMESINQYVPDIPIYLSGNNLELWARVRDKGNVIFRPNTATNFGDAYNSAIDYTFLHGHYDSLIVCNDDVVFTPTTYELLKKDYDFLRGDREFKVGWLGCRSSLYGHGVDTASLAHSCMIRLANFSKKAVCSSQLSPL